LTSNIRFFANSYVHCCTIN